MPSQLTSNAASWKQEVNRRVAEHKNRKGPVRVEPNHLEVAARPASSKAAEVLARVNARYAKAPSYNTALTEEARAVVRKAEAATLAAAEVQAAAEDMLAGLEAADNVDASVEPELIETRQAAPNVISATPQSAGEQPASYAVRWNQELPEHSPEPFAWAESRNQQAALVPQDWQGTAERESVLDTPDIEVVDGGQPIPGNLIEFPRELVATRKVRTRPVEPEAQLSIFEVDPASMTPLVDEPVPARLEPLCQMAAYEETVCEQDSRQEYAEPVETQTAYVTEGYAEPVFDQPVYQEPVYREEAYAGQEYAQAAYEAPYPDALMPRRSREDEAAPVAAKARPVRSASRAKHQTARTPELDLAPASTRMLAGLVNISLIMVGLALAGLTAVRGEAALPSVRGLGMQAGVGIVLIGFLYTALFYLLSDSTPGMRYAHLRLVGMDGRRSTRSQRFVRLGCLLLSALPMGLGFVWMIFDSENLCWHDRLSGTYLRRY